MFAKLYETELGQILVKVDSGENSEPEVRIFFEPEGLGVCSTAFTFKGEEEEQWERADEAFEKLTEHMCVELVEEFINKFVGKVVTENE